MGGLRHTAPIAGLSQKGRIDANDVVMLRRDVFRDGVVSHGEAEALFALGASSTDRCDEWAAFLVEAVGDFIVHQASPRGYVSEDNADWLVRAISSDGAVDGLTELELLVSVLEKARTAPPALSAFALKQVADAVISGKGPLARSEAGLTPGLVGPAEVKLLRRILHAGAGESGLGVSRAEADILVDINDRTVEEMNDPAWNELFVKSIANFVLCASGYEAPPRVEALAHEAFFESAEPELGRFFARMVSGGVAGLLDAYREPDSVEELFATRNAERAAAETTASGVDAGEAKWLADRIGRDHLLHDNERELLRFLKNHAGQIHPDLKPLLDKVA